MKFARFEPWSYVDFPQRDLRQPVRNAAASQWRPAVDIIEDKERFLLRADVPGVRPEDIEITMDAGILTLSGVRHASTTDDEAKLRRTERVAGTFSRQFTLPESTDADSIGAKCRDGILEVSIPKLPEVQPRQITVEAA
tara:strand:+ start:20476 stop:20892 length:417 start_codon:yes stop_codon:yes gene_type:complete